MDLYSRFVTSLAMTKGRRVGMRWMDRDITYPVTYLSISA